MNGSGVVVWITGLPSAGKTTFSYALHGKLAAAGVPACTLDGDELRPVLTPALGHPDAERESFYDALARLGALLAEQGLVVLVPATAHLRTFRQRAREAAPAFVEVFVDTPVGECRQRDTKGIYAAADAGAAAHVPGVDAPYEAPVEADVVAKGGYDLRALAYTLRWIVAVSPQG